MYSQVAKLFQNQEDLLKEFGQFLPDANGQGGFFGKVIESSQYLYNIVFTLISMLSTEPMWASLCIAYVPLCFIQTEANIHVYHDLSQDIEHIFFTISIPKGKVFCQKLDKFYACHITQFLGK